MPKIVFAIAFCLPLVAGPTGSGNLSKPAPSVINTEKLNAAGAIHLERFRGEVSIEGWDQPQVEITITKSGGFPEQAQVKSERRGDEIVISTQFPTHGRSAVNIGYNIKAPRDSKIVIDRGDGGVYISGISGDIETTLRRGQITLNIPEGAAYKIDAHTKLGDVYSEFEGEDRRRRLVGHDFVGHDSASGATGSTHELNLRIGIGDIVIMKAASVPGSAK